jgi:hypothetical protein
VYLDEYVNESARYTEGALDKVAVAADSAREELH